MDDKKQNQNLEAGKDNETSLHDQIMVLVKNGHFKMRPKWHFILKTLLFIIGIAAVFLALLYLASLFLFIARETGLWVIPAFGWRGITIFLISLPWILIISVLVFIVILELLVRHYPFAYRMPLIYSGLGILFLVAVSGLFVVSTPFHNKMADCPPEGGPPPCAIGLYRDLEPDRHQNLHDGTIIQISGRNYIIANRRQEQLLVIVGPETRFPFGSDFGEGDKIIIIGQRQGLQIIAIGISPFGKGWQLIVPKHGIK